MRRVPARAGAFCALLQVSAAASVMLLAQREMSAFVAAFAVLVVSLTLLTAMTKTSSQTAEAAFRQVLTGGVALATTVYGMTLLYAADGTTDLAKLSRRRARARRSDRRRSRRGGRRLGRGRPPGGGRGAAAAGLDAARAGDGPRRHRRVQLRARRGHRDRGAGSLRCRRDSARAARAGPLLVDVLAAAAMLSGGVLALRATTIRRLIADLSVAQAGFLLLALGATGHGISGSAVGRADCSAVLAAGRGRGAGRRAAAGGGLRRGRARRRHRCLPGRRPARPGHRRVPVAGAPRTRRPAAAGGVLRTAAGRRVGARRRRRLGGRRRGRRPGALRRRAWSAGWR